MDPAFVYLLITLTLILLFNFQVQLTPLGMPLTINFYLFPGTLWVTMGLILMVEREKSNSWDWSHINRERKRLWLVKVQWNSEIRKLQCPERPGELIKYRNEIWDVFYRSVHLQFFFFMKETVWRNVHIVSIQVLKHGKSRQRQYLRIVVNCILVIIYCLLQGKRTKIECCYIWSPI